MITLIKTIHEMQEAVIPEISMKKAEKICAKYGVTVSDMMIVSLAVHNLIDNGIVNYFDGADEIAPHIGELLRENGIYLTSFVIDCQMARVAIYEAEVKKACKPKKKSSKK